MSTENIEIVKKKRFTKEMIPTLLGTLIMCGVMVGMILNGVMINHKKNDLDISTDTASQSRIIMDSDTDTDSILQSEPEKKNESSKTEHEAVSSKEEKKTSSKKSESAESKNSKPSSSSKAASSHAASSCNAAAQIYTPVSNDHVTGEQAYVEVSPQNNSEVYQPEPVVEPEIIPETVNREEFDSEGRLIIDTDTLDGKKAIAITFDDGPSKYTKELLDGLNSRGAKATFFMVGGCVERYPDILPLMLDGGHQIGNHTWNHIVMTSTSEYTWSNEIAATDNAIYNACGEYATAFRPPYGAYNQYIAHAVDKTFTVWSVDTLDWQSRNTNSVRNNIVNYSKDGSIVLLHDLYKTSVDGALQAIDILKKQGYVFVTVDELLTRYGYPISNGAHFSQYPVSKTVIRPVIEPETDTEKAKPIDSEQSVSTESDINSSDTDTETDTDTDTETDTSSNYKVSDTDVVTQTDIDTETNTDNEAEQSTETETENDKTDTDLLESDSDSIENEE